MISPDNIALNHLSVDDDFIEDHYRELLILAKSKYVFSGYNGIPWGERFVLWRHDLDFSLNRALALAKIEFEVGVKSTYFVNLHSEFYNPLELKQFEIIQSILGLGHDLGLHFDGAFHEVSCEIELDRLVKAEAEILESFFGVKPTAFSFHNPVASHLGCEALSYGGLLNCYSQKFKNEVPYCSDSNGYWRFRRLHDVLNDGTDRCLQVLTHPGWWQKKPLAPRARIFRSIFGRAEANMQRYDYGIRDHARVNHVGPASALQFYQEIDPDIFTWLDFLWNKGQFQALFIELWRLHKLQVRQFCEAGLVSRFSPSPEDMLTILSERTDKAISKLFIVLFQKTFYDAGSVQGSKYQELVAIRDDIMSGAVLDLSSQRLETECVQLCQLIKRLADWGNGQDIHSELTQVSLCEDKKGLWIDFLAKVNRTDI